jgi:hypothetical protein
MRKARVASAVGFSLKPSHTGSVGALSHEEGPDSLTTPFGSVA